MNKSQKTLADAKELSTMLEQKPEIDSKVQFYKGVLKAEDGIVKSIDARIEKGYTEEKLNFLGFTISKKIFLDSYDIAKLELEKIKSQNQIEQQKKVFETWLMRTKQYEEKYDAITKDCEANYDSIFEKFKEVAKDNAMLKTQLERYEKEEKTQRLKNEFYLFAKHEVEKSEESARKLKVA